MTATLPAPPPAVALAARSVPDAAPVRLARAAAGDGGEVRLVAPARLVAGTAHAYRLFLVDVIGRAPRRVVVDVSAVEVLDAAGAAMLVGAARRLRRAGDRLLLAGRSDAVRDGLRRCGLGGLLSATAGEPGVALTTLR